MTVAELIAELSQLNPAATVIIIDNSDNDNPTPFPVQCCTEYQDGEITIEY